MSELPLAELLADLRARLAEVDGETNLEVWPVLNLFLDWGNEDHDRKTVAQYLMWKLPGPSGRVFYTRAEIEAVIRQLEVYGDEEE